MLECALAAAPGAVELYHEPAHAHRGDGLAAVDRGGARQPRLRPGPLGERHPGARDHAGCADRPPRPAALLQDRRGGLRGRGVARAVAADLRAVVRVPAGGARRGAARGRAARRARRRIASILTDRRAPPLRVAAVAAGRRARRLARRHAAPTSRPATSMPGWRTAAVAEAAGAWIAPSARSSGEIRRVLVAAFVVLSLLWNLPVRPSGFAWSWLAAPALEIAAVFALLALVAPLRTGRPGQSPRWPWRWRPRWSWR